MFFQHVFRIVGIHLAWENYPYADMKTWHGFCCTRSDQNTARVLLLGFAHIGGNADAHVTRALRGKE